MMKWIALLVLLGTASGMEMGSHAGHITLSGNYTTVTLESAYRVQLQDDIAIAHYKDGRTAGITLLQKLPETLEIADLMMDGWQLNGGNGVYTGIDGLGRHVLIRFLPRSTLVIVSDYDIVAEDYRL
jgi:hypothetical protein